MSDIVESSGEPGETTRVPYPDADPEVLVIPERGTEAAVARALLDAADDPRQVRTGDSGFNVPTSVLDRAKLPDGTETVDEAAGQNDDSTSPPHKAASK